MKNIKFEDLEIGQHVWIDVDGELVMAAKFDSEGYQVCGPWECGIGKSRAKIIKLVNFPEGYTKKDLYYKF